MPLCDVHAAKVIEAIRHQTEAALERADPNRNRSNRAMSSEDRGDAE
jgi:hypothetical protein